MHKSAIIGYGGMASEIHHHKVADSLGEIIEVAGVWDVRKERRDCAAAEGLKVYESLEELLGDPTTDIVVVATPNDSHKQFSIAALKAGKHVVCEKPVMMNCGELEETLIVARSVGKIFSAHQNRRWDKDFLMVKEVLSKGTLGKPFYIESRVMGHNGCPRGWRAYPQHLGGMLVDWGVHLVDQLICLMPQSKIKTIYATMLKVRENTLVDDNLKIAMAFDNGVHATVEVNTNLFIDLPLWFVCGHDGTMVINNWDCEGKIVCDRGDTRQTEEFITYPGGIPTVNTVSRTVENLIEYPLPDIQGDVKDMWMNFYRNFVAAIEGREPQNVTHEQMMRVMKVLEAARKSSDEGRSIECGI